MPSWALLIFLPRWSVTQRLFRQPWVSAVLGLCYFGALAAYTQEAGTDWMRSMNGRDPLALSRLLSPPGAAAASWIHFLAFDLFVGRWIVQDNLKGPVPLVVQSVCLFLTFMVGPVGLVSYLVARLVWRQLSGRVQKKEDVYG